MVFRRDRPEFAGRVTDREAAGRDPEIRTVDRDASHLDQLAQCGGVKAFAEDAEPLSPGDFIGKWMSLMAPAMDKVGPRGELSQSDYLTRLEQANVVNSLDNLLTFPRLRKLVETGRVAIHGAYFGVATGRLSVRDGATGEFRPIVPDDYARLFAQPRF